MKLLLVLALASAGLVAQEIDNPWVRVSRFHGSAPPSQLDSVVVALSGDTAYLRAGTVSTKQFGDSVLIELKPAAPVTKSKPVTLDPVKLDPEHHIALLENDRVRAIRTILEPHLKSPMHEHPHYVVVYLTELHTTMQIAGGKLIDNVRHPGEIAWRDRMQHVTENIGDRTAMEIQVELK